MSNLASAPPSAPETNSRLDEAIKPLHYDLVIKTDLNNRTFSGTARILIRVSKAVPSIILHTASPLVLQSAIVSRKYEANATSQIASSILVDQKTDHTEISFAGGVEAGEVELGLRWEGKLEPSMRGYYPAFYPSKTDSAVNSIYALTQFEATFARRAFVSRIVFKGSGLAYSLLQSSHALMSQP